MEDPLGLQTGAAEVLYREVIDTCAGWSYVFNGTKGRKLVATLDMVPAPLTHGAQEGVDEATQRVGSSSVVDSRLEGGPFLGFPHTHTRNES